MKDMRGKSVSKGMKVSALIAVGAQLISKIISITPDAILVEAEVAMGVSPETAATCLVLVNEGIAEQDKERWDVKAKRKVMDQRDNELKVGDDICSLIPRCLQVVGEVIDLADPHPVAMRQGKVWKNGIVTLRAYLPLEVEGMRVSCLLLPPEEKGDTAKRDDSGILLLH